MPVSPSAVSEVCEYFGSRYCIPVGSGTTGLYLAMTALDVNGGTVILPERTCPNVVIAVVASGGIPVPVRNDTRDYNISPAAVARAIDDSTKAVLAVSSFGYPVDVQEIRQAIGSYNVPIIDDACQAYGGTVNGIKLGNRGDIGVVSFGYAKPVDAKGGGLVLTNSKELAEKVERSLEDAHSGLISTFKNIVLRTLMRTGHISFANRLANSVDLLRYSMPAHAENRLGRSWADFVNEVPDVRDNLRAIDGFVRQIETVITFCYDWSLDWLPWRYSFKTSSQSAQREVMSFLKKHGIATSTLYLPLSDYPEIGGSLRRGEPNRELDNIINLRYRMTAASTGQLLERLESAVSA